MPHQSILEFSTPGRGLRDISDRVAAAVRESGVQCGVAHIFVQHTSCSLTISENADPDVLRDLGMVMDRLAPDGDAAYRHDAEGPDDMAAHVRSVLTGSALSVPIGAGQLLLGTWQGIYLWEHRTAPHRRKVVVTVLGS